MTSLAEFQRLVAGIGGEPGDDVRFLLAELPPELALTLRLCAIPHSFNKKTIAVLDPEFRGKTASNLIERLSRLSVIGHAAAELYIHERARKVIFEEWLQESSAEFAGVSLRLHRFFEFGATTGTEEAETFRRKSVFHLIGADQAGGFRYLRVLFQARYDQTRYSDCQALLRLAREYDLVLTTDNKLTLCLLEGLVAEGMRDNASARALLIQVAERGSGIDQIEAICAMARLLRADHLFSRAAAYVSRGFKLVDGLAEPRLYGVKLMLEDAFLARDSWDRPAKAETKLRRAALSAWQAGARDEFAEAENALGNLRRRRGETHAAIKHYLASLRSLDPETQQFKRARVLSNLGMAYADIADWKLSEKFYTQSFLIARDSQDLCAQARVLNNAARIFLRQGKLDEAALAYRNAGAMFATVGDHRATAVTFSNLAKILRESNLPTAVQAMDEAIARYRVLGDKGRVEALEKELAKWDPNAPAEPWTVKLVKGALVILLLWILVFSLL